MAIFCDECGEEMEIDDNGVSTHVGDTPDGIDHDLDADHTAFHDEYGDQSYEEYDMSDPYDIEFDVP